MRVFDSNRRETVDIPGEQFGVWLSSHMTESYGNRVNSMMLLDVTKQVPSKGQTGQQIPDDDFSMEGSSTEEPKTLSSKDDF